MENDCFKIKDEDFKPEPKFVLKDMVDTLGILKQMMSKIPLTIEPKKKKKMKIIIQKRKTKVKGKVKS
jgi:hypothetical protein